jgi:hypothetical protein
VPILVLAYPLPTPKPHAQDRCLAMGNALSRDELVFLDSLLVRLNDAVELAVRRSHRNGVPIFFVAETAGAFQPDHSLCDPVPFARTPGSFDRKRLRLKWGELPQAVVRRVKRGIREFVHPNQAGYDAVTKTVLEWSRGGQAAEAQRLLEAGGR